jgi:hypothetical protein
LAAIKKTQLFYFFIYRAYDKEFEIQQIRSENESLKQLNRTNLTSHSNQSNAPQIPIKPNLQRGIATIGSSGSSMSQGKFFLTEIHSKKIDC